MTDSTTDFNKRLRDMKRLSNQMAAMHSMESEWYARWDIGLDMGALVSSVFMLTLALASEDFVQRTTGIAPDSYKWIMAFWAALAFCLTLARLAWKPGLASALHTEAVHRYTKAKHEIATVVDSNVPVTMVDLKRIQELYLNSTDFPTIRNKRFCRLKQAHLTKVECSKALDRNPHESIGLIRKRLAKEARQKEPCSISPNENSKEPGSTSPGCSIETSSKSPQDT